MGGEGDYIGAVSNYTSGELFNGQLFVLVALIAELEELLGMRTEDCLEFAEFQLLVRVGCTAYAPQSGAILKQPQRLTIDCVEAGSEFLSAIHDDLAIFHSRC